jgi:hypothetical protein
MRRRDQWYFSWVLPHKRRAKVKFLKQMEEEFFEKPNGIVVFKSTGLTWV